MVFFKNISLILFLLLAPTVFLHAQQLAKTKISVNSGKNSESFRSFTFNGSWCWFSDPRAIYYEGKYKRTYAGWIDNYGNITIGTYDHETQQIETHIIMKNLEVDDHDNPALLIDEDGKLLVFFTRHGYGDSTEPKPIYLAKAKNSEDIINWEKTEKLFLNNEKDKIDEKTDFTHTYANPVRLTFEDNKLFIFWRGVDGKPGMSFSCDKGKSWSLGQILFQPEALYSFRRPYTKVYSDGGSKIHFTFTDGHPRNEKNNSIYYTYYENGSFYKANGTKIKDIAKLPLFPSELDKVYDAENGVKAWNWDVAQDKLGYPVIAYVKFPSDSAHIYCYAKWNGKTWQNTDLINSGGWFPKTKPGITEIEPNYSGGMVIDKENTNELYLSVKRDSVFEIEKWTTKNEGKSWAVDFITRGSDKDNIRPFAIINAKKDNPLQVLWMQNTTYNIYADAPWTGFSWEERFHSSIKLHNPSQKITNPLKPDQIVNIMRQVADWQFANPYDLKRIKEWHWATYLIGLQSLYELTNEDRYKQEMINIGQRANWRLEDNIFYADQMAIAANWAWLYGLDKNPEMIQHSKWAMDVHLATRKPRLADVRFANNPYFVEWWTWCDALFMGPPAFSAMYKHTGEEKYLEYMDTMYWITADYLYSKEDSLMFRDDRYFKKRSESGKKIFWGRGNGWVMAGLARILDDMPTDFKNRSKYESLFKEMSLKILSLQGKDHLWRTSLLDAEYHDKGEVSGSSFFTYALAWGFNRGLIDKQYRSQIENAWVALCSNINENGRLGNVQPEGIDPRKFTSENWQVYGTGAFLLAGGEMHKLK